MKTVAKLVAFICVLTLLLGCCSSAFADGKLSVYTAYPEEQLILKTKDPAST